MQRSKNYFIFINKIKFLKFTCDRFAAGSAPLAEEFSEAVSAVGFVIATRESLTWRQRTVFAMFQFLGVCASHQPETSDNECRWSIPCAKDHFCRWLRPGWWPRQWSRWWWIWHYHPHHSPCCTWCTWWQTSPRSTWHSRYRAPWG